MLESGWKRTSRFDYSKRVKNRRKIQIALCAGVVIALAVAAIFLFSGENNALPAKNREISKLWQEGAYQEAFEKSESALQEKPMDFFLLLVHGFSAYELAISQINNFDMISYIDRAIWALRKAMLTKQGENDSRVRYALGRAYHYKGADYAELCVKYLEEARAASYKAQDMAQFLGLAYAQINDWEQSVAAFAEALETEEGVGRGPSDILLLAIARSYIELEDREAARPYIMRAIDISKDWRIISEARLMLAQLLMDEGNIAAAETQVRTVLDEGGESAEVRYMLGMIYSSKNDYYRARYEWRRAYNLDPNYKPVREKFNSQ